MMKGREFQTIGAAICNEHKPKWRLVWGTYKLAEEDDCRLWRGM